jgi:hypothetical protein
VKELAVRAFRTGRQIGQKDYGQCPKDAWWNGYAAGLADNSARASSGDLTAMAEATGVLRQHGHLTLITGGAR